jgi:hypothetical protein
VQKQGIVQSADDYQNGVLRHVNRANVPLNSGSGSISVSSWGNIAVLNICGVTCTTVGDPYILGTLPTGFRPTVNTSVQLVNHNAGRYFTCIAAPNGNITVYNGVGITLANAWGCALMKITNDASSTTRIFEKIPLTINGTKKTLLQKQNSNYLCKNTTATNLNGTTGTLYVYKVDNFVFGSAVSYGVPQTGALNGFAAFQLPTGYRPKVLTYSCGAG